MPGGGVTEALIPAAVTAGPVQVAVLNQQIIRGNGRFRLGKQTSVFRNEALAGEDQVLGGLGGAGGAVDIDTVQGGGLAAHHRPAVIRFAHGLIGGGEIHDYLRALQRQHRGRWKRGPQILADFNSHLGVPHPEEKVRGDGNVMKVPAQVGGIRRKVHGGGEPAFFVEFLIVRDIGLGHQAVEDAAPQHPGAVEHLGPQSDGKAQHHGDGGMGPGAGGNPLQGVGQGVIQSVLEEQILAGIARQGQLRKYQQVRPCPIGSFQVGAVVGGIFLNVPHPDGGDGTGNANIHSRFLQAAAGPGWGIPYSIYHHTIAIPKNPHFSYGGAASAPRALSARPGETVS